LTPASPSAPLEDLVRADSPITYGVVKPGEEGDVRFIRGGDIVDGVVREGALRTITATVSQQYKRTLLRGGELLISLVGQPGQVAVANTSLAGANIARQVGLIRLREDVDAQFISYFLRSPDGISGLSRFTGGSVQQVINLSDLRRVRVPQPPRAEQQRIVVILDEAFEGIATAKANAEKNLQNARELFECHMQGVFSGHGKGWAERTLADVCDIASKLVDPREDQYIDLQHVGAGNIESKSGALFDVLTAREEQLISGKFLFDASMVLYSKIRPYLMKVVRPEFSGLCSADIYPLSPKQGQIDRDYLFYLLLTPAFTDYAIEGSARAGMPKVNREHLFAFRVALPPFQEQKAAASRLDALAQETHRLANIYERKLAALDELKKSLLHQAFSGAL
jgi:type I restriction enzyme S subunit